jgi:hypothetical protein
MDRVSLRCMRDTFFSYGYYVCYICRPSVSIIDNFYFHLKKALWQVIILKISTLEPRQGQEITVYTTASKPALEPSRPPIQWVPGPGIKWPGREADHSHPSCAEVNGGAISPLPYMSSWRGD